MKIHRYKTERCQGFTLIELLTVIFIIGLLAAILIPSVSVARRKAKETAAEQDLRSVATALSAYQIDNASLPPRPGCEMAYFLTADFLSLEHELHELWTPYLARLGMIGGDVRTSFHDRFSRSEDLNRNSAPGRPYETPGEWAAEDQTERIADPITQIEIFGPPNGVIDRGQVPYQYFPVDSRNMAKFRRIVAEMVSRGEDNPNADRPYTLAELTDPQGELGIGVRGLTLPAQRYDRFVLFSLGPQESDQGIIPRYEGVNIADPEVFLDLYADDLRLRAYYRATRDLNGNQVFDFNYRDRVKKVETGPLPDGSSGWGVMIFSGP